MNSIEKNMLLRQGMWIAISIGLSIAVNIGLTYLLGDPFPWNWIVLIGTFLALGFFIQRRTLRRAGMLPSKTTGKKEYQCFNCGTSYKGSVCPKCGARGGKMTFSEGGNPFK